MSIALTKYLVYCNDEQSSFATDYLTGAARCPNNSGHTIDPTKTTVLTTFTTNTVNINQGSDTTQGLYKIKGVVINIPAGNTGDVTLSDFVVRTYPTSTIKGTILPTQDNVGDMFTVYTKPDFIVGSLAYNLSAGSTGMTMVSVTGVKLGSYLKLDNGTTSTDLSECKTISNNFVTFQNATDRDYSAGTLVKMSITNILNYPIVFAMPTDFGKLAGIPVPAGLTSRMSYTNNSGLPKKINIVFETFY